MSVFPKTARHPEIDLQIEKWHELSDSINVENRSQLSDYSEFSGASRRVKKTEDLEFFYVAREVVGASAIRALAKSYESLDALVACEPKGINMSAMIQAYYASYFAARAFCMLMGFSPLDRDCSITADVFEEDALGRGRKFDVLRLHKYKRWGHSEVWNLTQRLIDTGKFPDDLRHLYDWLKGANLKNSPKLRNSFNYDDSRLAPIEDNSFVDFPDVVKLGIFDQASPVGLNHQFHVANNLIQICLFIIRKANLRDTLLRCVSKRRLKIEFSTPKH